MALELIPSKTWMSDTAVMGLFRSDQLKDLDQALKSYEELKSDSNLSKVRRTFEAWKLKEGMGWRQSKRNGRAAFSKLEELLNPRAATPYDDALAHSRKGLVYLFSQMEVESGVGKVLIEGAYDVFESVADIDALNIPGMAVKAAKGVKEVSLKVLEQRGSKPAGPKPGAPSIQLTLWEKIKKYLMDFAKKIWESLKTKYSEFYNSSSLEKFETIWGPATKLVNLVAGNVFVSAVPFLGGAIDVATGIKDTTVACYHRYIAYTLGKGVVLNEGHPGVIAASIERAMNLGIGKGLYDTFKGAGNLAMQGASFGGAAVVSAVIAGCELIAKVVYRLWEASGMRTFFEDCKEKWIAKDKIYEGSADFTKWYSKAAYALPCLSALAVNSGITGDKMAYLNMFTDGGLQKTTITQAKFDQGASYIEKLKSWSLAYLEDTGYDFDSKDTFVKSLLKRTITSKKPVLTEIFTKQNINPNGVAA